MMTRSCLFPVICSLLLIPVPGCKGQSVVTPEQAMDAVRAFEGDNNLQLRCSDLKEMFMDRSEWEHERSYGVDDIQNEDHSWTIDAVTGEVVSASYYDALPDDWPQRDDPFGPLSQEQCRQIAEGFAGSKCSWFGTANMHLEEEWDQGGWSFSWGERTAYDAETPNGVSVEVNPADGRIQGYSCRRIPIPTPPAPQITAQQAIDAVQADRGLVSVYGVMKTMLFANPDGIFWELIDLTGEDTQGKLYACSAEVDAVTGQIIDLSDDSWGPPPGAQPPPMDGDPISLRELVKKLPSARVHWLGKEARLFVGKGRYTLVPGKDSIEWTGGGTIKLAQKMKIVDGRLMVPSDLLDILKAAPAKAPNAQAKSN